LRRISIGRISLPHNTDSRKVMIKGNTYSVISILQI